jgi:Rha family phage regulatory protein
MTKELVFIKENNVVTDSLLIAEMFDKRHDNVVRDIAIQIDYSGIEFAVLNFEECDYINDSATGVNKNRKYKKYELTEEAFMLVVMSYNTKEAVQTKIKFIQEFKRMKEYIQNQQQLKLPANYKEALLQLVEEVDKNEKLQLENAQQNQIIYELKPKATYYDLVLQNKSLLSVSKIAKDYGWSAIKMNQKLHELGIQFKQGDCWLLYQKYADKGYTQSTTHVIDNEKSKLSTKWTQKGRLFIYDTLKRQEILPLIEREEREVS